MRILITSTGPSTEIPTRDQLIRMFAQRHPKLSLQEVGELFDDYMILGHLEVRRDEETGEWLVALYRNGQRRTAPPLQGRKFLSV
jgi:hypothetical protein